MRYQLRADDDAKHDVLTRLAPTLVAAGIALRLWQFFARSALWTDEATIANNIVDRSLKELITAPLGHNQAAPVGFLFIEKLAAMTLGPNELALRAYPLLSSILALVLLWRVAKRLLPAPSIPIVLAPFAFAPLLIFHAAEVKQYSSDVAISIALLLVALEVSDVDAIEPLPTWRIALAAATGALAVWLSQPAVLVVAGLGVALAIGALGARGQRRARQRTELAFIVGVWAVSALAATSVSLHHLTPNAHRFMSTFWSDGFWPLSLRHPSSVAWPVAHTALLLGSQLGLPTSIGLACALLAAVGIVATWRSAWRTSLVLVMPLVIALGASAAALYPFAERLALFLVPSLLLLAAIGVAEIAASVRLKSGASVVMAMATIFVLVVEAQALYAAPPVYRREEITPAIAYLRRASRAPDASYIYYGAEPAYAFYNARDALPARATMGGCHRGDSNAYLAELDRFRGRSRVWLLFAHELPRLHEREMMLTHLDSLGTKRDSMTVKGRDASGNATYVRLYLYDLAASPPIDSTVARATPDSPSGMIEPRLQCSPPGE